MRDPGTPDRSGRGGGLDLATRVGVVQAAYSDAQHDLDAILTPPADPVRRGRSVDRGLPPGAAHLRAAAAQRRSAGDVVVRDEILEAVRKPSRIEGVIGDSGTGGGMV